MSEEVPGSPEQLPELSEGLSAVPLPEFRDKDQWNDFSVNPTREKAQEKLDAFLGELNRQGADIVTVLDIMVDRESEWGGKTTSREEIQRFLVVRKSKSG